METSLTGVTRRVETKTKRGSELACRNTRRSRAKRFSTLTNPLFLLSLLVLLSFAPPRLLRHTLRRWKATRTEKSLAPLWEGERVKIVDDIRLITSITLRARCQISDAWREIAIGLVGELISSRARDSRPGSEIHEVILITPAFKGFQHFNSNARSKVAAKRGKDEGKNSRRNGATVKYFYLSINGGKNRVAFASARVSFITTLMTSLLN